MYLWQAKTEQDNPEWSIASVAKQSLPFRPTSVIASSLRSSQ